MVGGGGHGHFGMAQSQAEDLRPGTSRRWTPTMWLCVLAGFLPFVAIAIVTIIL